MIHFFGNKDLEKNRHEFIKKLFCFNFSIDKKKTDLNYSIDRRIVIMIQEKPKCSFTSSIFNEHNLNFKKLKKIFKYEEMCELAGISHLKYELTEINQAIILIHDCVYTKDARKIIFNFTDHLHKMMKRQSEEFDIGEEYVCSMGKPLYDLLNKVIIKDHSPFIKV